MMLTAICLLVVVTQLASADPTYDNNQDSDVIREADENLVRKGSDSVMTQVLLTMSRLQYDMSSLAKSVRDLQNDITDIKDDITDIKSVQLTQQSKMAIHQNTTIQLQNDVADIKSAVNKPPVPRKKGCPAGFKYVSAVNGCYKMVLDAKEWSVAALRCKSLNKDAHLVFVNNAEEQRHLASLLTYYGREGCWMGGQRIDPSVGSTFVWKKNPTDGTAEGATDMSEMTYTNWQTGQPDNWAKARQSCMLFWRPSHYTWHDSDCTGRQSSICELDL